MAAAEEDALDTRSSDHQEMVDNENELAEVMSSTATNLFLLKDKTKLKQGALYGKVKDTCVNLQKAVKGLVIFSPELEAVAHGILTNSIPPSWLGVSYPSLKPLMSYVYDFIARLKFLDDWIKQGIPNTMWFSAFFFQQALLTGAKQNFARKHIIAIDQIDFSFIIISDETKYDL